MYMMLKIAKSFRVCSSQLENNIFRSREICVCAFYFFCCCSFPEYVFVGYGISFCWVDGTWQIVKYRFWKKSTIVSVYGLENKTIASQESEKIFEKKKLNGKLLWENFLTPFIFWSWRNSKLMTFRRTEGKWRHEEGGACIVQAGINWQAFCRCRYWTTICRPNNGRVSTPIWKTAPPHMKF